MVFYPWVQQDCWSTHLNTQYKLERQYFIPEIDYKEQ